jgi:hypothetical protein
MDPRHWGKHTLVFMWSALTYRPITTYNMGEWNTFSVPAKNYQENPFNGIHNTDGNMFNILLCIWPKTATKIDFIAWNFYVVKPMDKIIAIRERKWNLSNTFATSTLP